MDNLIQCPTRVPQVTNPSDPINGQANCIGCPLHCSSSPMEQYSVMDCDYNINYSLCSTLSPTFVDFNAQLALYSSANSEMNDFNAQAVMQMSNVEMNYEDNSVGNQVAAVDTVRNDGQMFFQETMSASLSWQINDQQLCTSTAISSARNSLSSETKNPSVPYPYRGTFRMMRSTFVCPLYWCSLTFDSKHRMDLHLHQNHSINPCQCLVKGCKEVFQNR